MEALPCLYEAFLRKRINKGDRPSLSRVVSDGVLRLAIITASLTV